SALYGAASSTTWKGPPSASSPTTPIRPASAKSSRPAPDANRPGATRTIHRLDPDQNSPPGSVTYLLRGPCAALSATGSLIASLSVGVGGAASAPRFFVRANAFQCISARLLPTKKVILRPFDRGQCDGALAGLFSRPAVGSWQPRSPDTVSKT